MKAVKFLGKFLAVIFSCLFAIFLLLIMYIFIAKTMLNEDSISYYISDSNIFDCSSDDIHTSDGKNNLRDYIGDDLFKIGIPISVTDKVIDSASLNSVLTQYGYDYIDYVLYSNNRPVFDTDKVVNIVNNNYAARKGHNLSDKQLSSLNSYVMELESKLDDTLPSVSEFYDMGVNIYILRIIANFSSSNYIWIVFLMFSITFYSLIALCLWNKSKAFKWTGFIVLIDGMLLIVSSFLEVRLFSMVVNGRGIIDNLVVTILGKNFENLLLFGIGFIVLGIIFLIICASFMKKEQQENSDKILDTVIKEETLLGKEPISGDLDVSPNKGEITGVIDKVILETIDDKDPSSSVLVIKDDEIPVIDVMGNDFESKDNDSIVPDEKLFNDKDVVSDDGNDEKEVNIGEESLSDDSSDEDKDIEIVNDNNYAAILDDDSLDNDDSEDVKTSDVVVMDSVSEEDGSIDDPLPLNSLDDYEELDDSINKDIIPFNDKVSVPVEVKLDVISPKKGKGADFEDIEVLDNDDEIELL